MEQISNIVSIADFEQLNADYVDTNWVNSHPFLMFLLLTLSLYFFAG